MNAQPRLLPPPNPQNLAMFAQMMAQQYGIPPANLQGPQPGQQMPPQGAPQMPPGGQPPQGMPPQPPAGMQPGQPPMGQPPQSPPPGPGMLPGPFPQPGTRLEAQNHRFTPPEMAALGRLGDNTVAHLTKGEIAVPPEVQSPKVLATLKQAFKKAHVPPQNFVAGSPTSSVNPNTGAPEYSFWSSFLPIAGGIAGTLLAPGVGTMLGSSLAASTLGAIGGGLGTTLGGLAGGKGFTNSLMQGGMAGLGSYGLGQLMGPSSDAVKEAALQQPTASAANAPQITGVQSMGGGSPMSFAPTGSDIATEAAKGIPQAALNQARTGLINQNNLQSLWQTLPDGIDAGNVFGAAGGAYLGDQMFGNQGNANTSHFMQNFNKPYTPPGQLPSAQDQLGQNTYNGPTPNFTNYNPATNYPMAYNFFPSSDMTKPQSVTG